MYYYYYYYCGVSWVNIFGLKNTMERSVSIFYNFYMYVYIWIYDTNIYYNLTNKGRQSGALAASSGWNDRCSQQTAEEKRKWKHQHCQHTHSQDTHTNSRHQHCSGTSIIAPAGLSQLRFLVNASLFAAFSLHLFGDCYYYLPNIDDVCCSLRLGQRFWAVSL